MFKESNIKLMITDNMSNKTKKRGVQKRLTKKQKGK